MTTLIPIQSAAMFQVDQVLSLIVVGARSRFQSRLCETSVCSSTKSRCAAGDSSVIFVRSVLIGVNPWLNIYTRSTLQKLSITGFPLEVSLFDDHLAARQYRLNHALDLLTFVG